MRCFHFLLHGIFPSLHCGTSFQASLPASSMERGHAGRSHCANFAPKPLLKRTPGWFRLYPTTLQQKHLCGIPQNIHFNQPLTHSTHTWSDTSARWLPVSWEGRTGNICKAPIFVSSVPKRDAPTLQCHLAMPGDSDATLW